MNSTGRIVRLVMPILISLFLDCAENMERILWMKRSKQLRCISLGLCLSAIATIGLAQEAPRPTPNEEHLSILRQGVEVWNKWRIDNPAVIPDLSGANLADAILSGSNLGELFLGDDIKRTNLSGAILVSADLRRAKLYGVDLRDADLQGADLGEADLFGAILIGARFNTARLTKANLNCTDMHDATFSGADLCRAGISHANLTGARLNGVNLDNSYLWASSLKGAIINGSTLRNANLVQTDLSGAVLSKTDLTGAELSGAKLEGADLKYSRLDDAIFDPETVPIARNLVGASGLKTLRLIARHLETGVIAYDIGAIMELRESARTAGLRDMERELTCSIERTRNQNPNREWYARVLSWFLFDLICEYGAAPARPLWVLLYCIIIGALFYSFWWGRRSQTEVVIDYSSKHSKDLHSTKLEFLLRYRLRKRHSWVRWISRVSHQPFLNWISRIEPAARYMDTKGARAIRLLRLGLYFSLQSAFNVGYRDLNIGSWLERLQFRPYTLRAAGPIRAISGLQSLIGLYLLAMWVLCTFSQPFG